MISDLCIVCFFVCVFVMYVHICVSKLRSYCMYDFVCYAMSLQLCPTVCDPMNCSPRLLRPWDSPGKNTGMVCHFFLQIYDFASF